MSNIHSILRKCRGSLNLELALIITLLILVVIFTLNIMANGISDNFMDAAMRLDSASFTSFTPQVAGAEFENNGWSTDSTWTVAEGNTPDLPYTIYASLDRNQVKSAGTNLGEYNVPTASMALTEANGFIDCVESIMRHKMPRADGLRYLES